MSAVRDAVHAFGIVTFAYFLALNGTYLATTAVAWRSVVRYLRTRRFAASEELFASPLTPPVTILLPAFNEEAGVVQSVKSLLALRYPEHEVVVINDGSTDATLDQLRTAFDLVPVVRALRGGISCAPIRATFVSRRDNRLWVVDKENGGKADALNAGANAAQFPYVCAVDADAVIEEDALLRVMRPIVLDPDIVAATGGIVRIANGCEIDHGRVNDVRLPASRLATFQVVEYFRAFLIGRVGWSSIGSLVIISGAFGVFRRDDVEAIGGWSIGTVGEDIELVVRLHRHLRRRGAPYKIEFVADPVCWTEAPDDVTTLGRQRRRWQRGLAETLWRHRTMAFNPRYGVVGLAGIPYFLVFEILGPVIEALAYPVMAAAAATGAVSLTFFIAFLVVAVLAGMLLSVAALALEEFSFRRHPRHRDVVRMLAYALIENVGYRQLTSIWRVVGLVDALRRRRGWGVMRRRGLGVAASSARPAES